VAGCVHTFEICGNESAGGNFGVPAGEVLFVAPELIGHYVSIHGYLPPDGFLDALLTAPLPGTHEYTIAVREFPR